MFIFRSHARRTISSIFSANLGAKIVVTTYLDRFFRQSRWMTISFYCNFIPFALKRYWTFPCILIP
jgi:hypothetical protein